MKSHQIVSVCWLFISINISLNDQQFKQSAYTTHTRFDCKIVISKYHKSNDRCNAYNEWRFKFENSNYTPCVTLTWSSHSILVKIGAKVKSPRLELILGIFLIRDDYYLSLGLFMTFSDDLCFANPANCNINLHRSQNNSYLNLQYAPLFIYSNICNMFLYPPGLQAFTYNTERFAQVDGSPKGSSLSPVAPCLYLEVLDRDYFSEVMGADSTWLRYVDCAFLYRFPKKPASKINWIN